MSSALSGGVALTASKASRLEKAAMDNGFDMPGNASANWLEFRSSQSPLIVWLTCRSEETYGVAVSHANVALALGEFGTPLDVSPPQNATGGRCVSNMVAVHRLLRRAFQLSRSLPNALLDQYLARASSLPKSTEAERLVVQRVGQDIFRNGLLQYWEGRCAITGLAVPALLKASHIKPWASCESDTERLDVFNGLLLAPHLDAAFDSGLITVGDDGTVIISSALDDAARRILSLDRPLRLSGVSEGHRAFLPWHRDRVFKRHFDPPEHHPSD
jgi:hypothetical protein